MIDMKRLALKYGTDKANNDQYLEAYEEYFSKIKKSAENILEIGVKRAPVGEEGGARSLKLWKEYFDGANIFGLDIDPENKKYEEEKIKIYIGNQGDHQFLDQMVKDIINNDFEQNQDLNSRPIIENSKLFDVIIDDGSHVNELTLASFDFLWPFIKSGGIYLIEDLGCGYIDLEEHGDVRRKSADSTNSDWWGMDLLGNTSYRNDRSIMDSFFQQKIKDLDFLYTRESFRELVGAKFTDIKSIHFYSGICIFIKA